MKSKTINYEPDYDDVKGDISSLLEKIKERKINICTCNISNGMCAVHRIVGRGK